LPDHEQHDDHSNTSSSTRPAIIDIPEDIVEENEDDDNFASSAVSETMQFTGLSPPPLRAVSPAPTITPRSIPAAPTRPPPRAPTLQIPSAAVAVATPADFYPLSALRSYPSPQSPDSASLPGFYHSESEAEDDVDMDAEHEGDMDIDMDMDVDADAASPSQTTPRSHASPTPNPLARNLAATLSTYSLPRTATAGADGKPCDSEDGTVSAAPMLPLSLPEPDSAGLGQLVSEMGWMADFI
jgi:hypothetical protein